MQSGGTIWSSMALKTSLFKHTFRCGYWTVIVLTTFIAAVGWAIPGKKDAAAIQFLAFINGITDFTLLFWKDPWRSELLTSASSKWFEKTVRGINHSFKVVHATLCVLFAVGAIVLILQFPYKNLQER
jgi:hypothetical protein